MKPAPIFYFDEELLVHCPKAWQRFIYVTRDYDNPTPDDSDEHYIAECKRYGIVHEGYAVFFESDEARTIFLLAFGNEQS